MGVSSAGRGPGLASGAISQDCGWSSASRAWLRARGGWGVLGWSKPRCPGRPRRPPSWLGLCGLWEQGWSQAASLGFAVSGASLLLGIVSEFAKTPHSSMLALCLNRESGVGWAGDSGGFLAGEVLELGLATRVEFAHVGRGGE